ncbi:hypothetical protein AB0E10_15640 [Streptomyces sp. NPDC048045]|uniref:hypothetical protein n=1 Tax=Streptomyces sp. NPDC048045 TaxID=3154710 RepID=UPI00342D6068
MAWRDLRAPGAGKVAGVPGRARVSAPTVPPAAPLRAGGGGRGHGGPGPDDPAHQHRSGRAATGAGGAGTPSSGLSTAGLPTAAVTTIPFDVGTPGGRGKVQITLDPGRFGRTSVQAVVYGPDGGLSTVPELRVTPTLTGRHVGPVDTHVTDRGGYWSADSFALPHPGTWNLDGEGDDPGVRTGPGHGVGPGAGDAVGAATAPNTPCPAGAPAGTTAPRTTRADPDEVIARTLRMTRSAVSVASP